MLQIGHTPSEPMKKDIPLHNTRQSWNGKKDRGFSCWEGPGKRVKQKPEPSCCIVRVFVYEIFSCPLLQTALLLQAPANSYEICLPGQRVHNGVLQNNPVVPGSGWLHFWRSGSRRRTTVQS